MSNQSQHKNIKLRFVVWYPEIKIDWYFGWGHGWWTPSHHVFYYVRLGWLEIRCFMNRTGAITIHMSSFSAAQQQDAEAIGRVCGLANAINLGLPYPDLLAPFAFEALRRIERRKLDRPKAAQRIAWQWLRKATKGTPCGVQRVKTNSKPARRHK